MIFLNLKPIKVGLVRNSMAAYEKKILALLSANKVWDVNNREERLSSHDSSSLKLSLVIVKA